MREFGAPLRICLPVWAVPALWAPTGRCRGTARVPPDSGAAGFSCRSPAVCRRRLQRGISFCFLTNGSNCQACRSWKRNSSIHSGSTLSEPIEVYREAMDLSRFSSNSYKTLLRDFLRAKYADKKIDVAVAIMAPALDFLMAYGDLIFPGASVVFCGLDRGQLGARSLPPNMFGVLIKREFAPTLELALHLHPATERRGGRFRNVRFRRRASCAGPSRFPSIREPGFR